MLVAGLAAGSVLVAGLAVGGAPGKRFLGICMILVGFLFLWVFFLEKIPEYYPELGLEPGFNVYTALTLGPIGIVLCPALLVIGYRILLRERFVGACMMVIGIGCLPAVALHVVSAVIGTYVFDSVELYWWAVHAVPAMGAVLIPLGVVMAVRTIRPR
ncbi:MAG: hypothetical protein EB830_06200 [Nitrosopumilus sp. H13]|nr:MAG: hypothetical protein EB830_06200 [Nitrosopumilus sp. H13]